jgi:hypothetical protein
MDDDPENRQSVSLMLRGKRGCGPSIFRMRPVRSGSYVGGKIRTPRSNPAEDRNSPPEPRMSATLAAVVSGAAAKSKGQVSCSPDGGIDAVDPGRTGGAIDDRTAIDSQGKSCADMRTDIRTLAASCIRTPPSRCERQSMRRKPAAHATK